MKLVYVDPVTKETRTYDLKVVAAVRFGRSREDNHVVLRCRKDPLNANSEEDRDFSLKISRHHMEIALQDGRAVVIDRGAKKGTFLDDRQLAANEPHILADGDIVKVSDVVHLRIGVQPGEVRVTREEPGRTFVTVLGKTEAKTVSEYSKSLETSMMVVLFTDQVGSTKQADTLGEKEFHKLRRKRDKIQTEIVQRGGAGRTVKSTGDGVLCVFNAPQMALERCIEIQRTLKAHNQTVAPGEQIHMRIGVDMGQVAIDRQFNFDVFGMHVNRAARVMSHADGGEILLTKTLYDSVRGWMTRTDISFVSLGEIELKGISEPVHLYRLVYDMNVATTSPPGPK